MPAEWIASHGSIPVAPREGCAPDLDVRTLVRTLVSTMRVGECNIEGGVVKISLRCVLTDTRSSRSRSQSLALPLRPSPCRDTIQGS
jgi:hypothetical protein